ncbi:hypothetical protein POM88_053006 [Heracleum sosnowskyi]|uniref:Protein kinase domain-containing protein n=1 Tax=Heracleum sosnowskyi TaxID=360622 RepID=A0AAD8GRC8_9APIA|nr:hypothetical protein POM88_053006 [Heracleum sosnowskyi]
MQSSPGFGWQKKDQNMKGPMHVSTDIDGTVCYIAPEYVATGHLTMKSDVYGFGVVLREILTGQSVFELLHAREEGLVSWRLSLALPENRRFWMLISKANIRSKQH